MSSSLPDTATSPSRVHVTGAEGFIGRALLARLRARGHQVSGSDVTGSKEAAALDLRERQAVVDHIAALAPDVVVHAGAISGAMLATDDPALVFDVNVHGTLNLAEAMRLAGVRRLVFLSSNAVYAPAATRDRVGEDAPVGPSDAYGASKLAAEAVLRCYAQSQGIATLALRISSVFGPGRVTPYLIGQALEAIRSGVPLTVTDERSNMRQFVHVDDVVEAVSRAVETELPGFTPINITGGSYLSEEAIVRRLAGDPPRVPIAVIASHGRDDDGCVGPLDLARAHALLGYRPAVDIVAALDEMAGPIVAGSSPTR